VLSALFVHRVSSVSSQKLIIIRGNSGSGKTTVAKRVQRELGKGTMLVPEDVLRREILWVRWNASDLSAELIKRTVLYGKEIRFTVVLEGILPNEYYLSMIEELIGEFNETHAYYFDLPFEETLRRHATKSNANEFGEVEMRDYWCETDYLGISGEQKISAEESEDEIVARIVNDCRY